MIQISIKKDTVVWSYILRLLWIQGMYNIEFCSTEDRESHDVDRTYRRFYFKFINNILNFIHALNFYVD